jgi:hypothetical protein
VGIRGTDPGIGKEGAKGGHRQRVDGDSIGWCGCRRLWGSGIVASR